MWGLGLANLHLKEPVCIFPRRNFSFQPRHPLPKVARSLPEPGGSDQRGHAVPLGGGSSPAGPLQQPAAQAQQNHSADESAAKLEQLLKGAASDLGISFQEAEHRLQQLGTLLPGLRTGLALQSPAVAAQLLSDPPALMDRLVQLKRLLPAADVGTLAVADPALLLLSGLEEVQAELECCRLRLGLEDLNAAIEADPQLVNTVALFLRFRRHPSSMMIGYTMKWP